MYQSRLDPAELIRIAGEFDTNRDAITDALKKFEGEIAVIAAKWKGQAGLGFQNVAETWRRQQTDLTDSLRLTAEDVRQVAGINSRANDEALQEIKIHMPLDTKGA